MDKYEEKTNELFRNVEHHLISEEMWRISKAIKQTAEEAARKSAEYVVKSDPFLSSFSEEEQIEMAVNHAIGNEGDK